METPHAEAAKNRSSFIQPLVNKPVKITGSNIVFCMLTLYFRLKKIYNYPLVAVKTF